MEMVANKELFNQNTDTRAHCLCEVALGRRKSRAPASQEPSVAQYLNF